LQANANGFTIDTRTGGVKADNTPAITLNKKGLIATKADGTPDADAQANIDYIKKLIKNKKFSDYAMFDSSQAKKSTATIAVGAKTLFPIIKEEYDEKTDLSPKAAVLIDFRKNDEWFGVTKDGVDYSDKVKPDVLRGFKITDSCDADGKKKDDGFAYVGGAHGENMNDAYKNSLDIGSSKEFITKIALDI